MLDADLATSPTELSCTGFVAVVFRRSLGDAMARSFVDDSHSMWRNLKGALAPVAAQHVLPGDLAFFTRESTNPGDPCTGPGGTAQEWHVMMVSLPTTMLIGACPMLEKVHELDTAQYVQRKDDKGRCWTLKEHRRLRGL